MGNMKTALICGMAKSGIASARLLAQDGYHVIINDSKAEIPGLKAALNGIDYTDALGVEPATLLTGVDLLVLSPVIPLFAPFAAQAQAMGIEVIGEIELGYRYCNPQTQFVCISGTNGKTTTTALTGELFRTAGKTTFVLGNIGIPITQEALHTRPGDVVVAEVAALQLESIARFRPHAMGMLNIAEDHLNRFEYKLENYIAAKCRAFENQAPSDFAVLNYDDATVRDMAKRTRARTVYFSQNTRLTEGLCLAGGYMVWRWEGRETRLIRPDELRIPGAHNLQNAMCAAALALCMGLEPEAVRQGLRAFAGVEHRIEFVREVNGVRFINDSKGTNPASTIKAVQAMDRPTILMLGVGDYDKQSDFAPLFQAFGGRVKGVIASGCNIPAICRAAKETGFTAIRTYEGDYEGMIREAAAMAQPGDAVLLSPAAASWGQFDNFEQRGDRFKEIVQGL
ncbi:MAG: UDP-N-acetylmuramoyl-L-alanine--D-glutamate ligase [Christensenellaceae bacterium]|jgi:UDP-N-acetylmuramoylalanine--D-glutamate ligase|nr:UDP-N-acetylmuramoyl-L-alanine--D-glutamate ligase [Christensenellaceae bacterium]